MRMTAKLAALLALAFALAWDCDGADGLARA